MSSPRFDPSAAAGRLIAAQADHVQLRSLAHDHPGLGLDDAYAVQHAWANARRAAGARLAGYKVGLTTPAVQRACGIVEPTYGHLFDDMILPAGGLVPVETLFEPRIETELAFVLATDLAGPAPTLDDVLAATAYVVPAVEIVDMRFGLKDPDTGAVRGTFDTVADNTSSAAVILGDARVAADAIDLAWAAAILYRDGVHEASGVSGMVMGHPAASLAWLADTLHRRGERLRAGQVIMSGSFITPFPAADGQAFVADFGPLGRIGLRFG